MSLIIKSNSITSGSNSISFPNATKITLKGNQISTDSNDQITDSLANGLTITSQKIIGSDGKILFPNQNASQQNSGLNIVGRIEGLFPLPPTNVNASAIIGQTGKVSVSFLAPSLITSPIISYLVTSNPGGITASSSSSPITVSGLALSTFYTFTVQSYNSSGYSPLSIASNSIRLATVPDSPTISNVVAGNGQCTVSFSTPNNNGSPITYYSIIAYTKSGSTYSYASGSQLTNATASDVNITGLTNGTTYYFNVFARNSVGDSVYSSYYGPVTPATVPDAPIIGNVVAGNSQCTVSFSAPLSTGGSSIDYYVATAYTLSGSTYTSQRTSSVTTLSPITITGLTNGTTYYVNVYAHNDIGNGLPSSYSNAFTPVAPNVLNNGTVFTYGGKTITVTNVSGSVINGFNLLLEANSSTYTSTGWYNIGGSSYWLLGQNTIIFNPGASVSYVYPNIDNISLNYLYEIRDGQKYEVSAANVYIGGIGNTSANSTQITWTRSIPDLSFSYS